jgi:hypothetical protein
MARVKKPLKLCPPYYYLVAEKTSDISIHWYNVPIQISRYRVYALGSTFADAMRDFLESGIFECCCSYKIYRVDVGGGRTTVASISDS